MSKTRDYLKMKKKQNSLDEVDSKIKRHRRKMVIGVGIALAVLAFIGVIAYLVLSNMTFTNYKVLSSVERTDETNAQYMEFQSNLLRYSKDGVSYVDYNNKEIWNQAFEMSNPIVDVNGESAVIADQSGNHVYIFNTSGLQGEFQTKLTIEKVRVSQKGIVAILLKDDTSNWINYYDKNGTLLVENRKTMSGTGYPLDFAVSADGLKIMISYLYVSNGTMSTTVAFYNFDSVGQEEIDNLVSSKEYADMIVPVVGFMTNEVSFAVSDDRIVIFKGKEIPKAEIEIELEDTIKSVFNNEKYIGVVLENESDDEKYKLMVFSAKGDIVVSQNFSAEIKNIQFGFDNSIIVNGTDTLTVFNSKGVMQFNGTVDHLVQNVVPLKGFQKYMIISDTGIEQIRLGWSFSK